MNTEQYYRLYSSLIQALLESNQFKFKLVRYCQRISPDNPLSHCVNEVARPENIVLCYREDGKLWVFFDDSDELSIDQRQLPMEGKQALVLLIQFALLCSRRELINGKVVMHDWQQITFFQQTFAERLKHNSEKLFDDIPPPLHHSTNK